MVERTTPDGARETEPLAEATGEDRFTIGYALDVLQEEKDLTAPQLVFRLRDDLGRPMPELAALVIRLRQEGYLEPLNERSQRLQLSKSGHALQRDWKV